MLPVAVLLLLALVVWWLTTPTDPAPHEWLRMFQPYNPPLYREILDMVRRGEDKEDILRAYDAFIHTIPVEYIEEHARLRALLAA
jgi:hypothetical protein